MANVNAATNSWNCPNYAGEIFLVGEDRTPFINMMGGMAGAAVADAMEFPIGQPWSLDQGAQPAITESASLTAPAPKTFVRGQRKNVCQIFHEQVSISYLADSQNRQLQGLNIAGQTNPIGSEKDFQIMATLKQIALDLEYTFLNGSYNLAAAANQANQTRGIIEAITTNTIDAAAAVISTALIKQIVKMMADNNASLNRPVLLCNSTNKQRITDLYDGKFTTDDRNYGGMAIDTILTDFCVLGVAWAPYVPADTIVIAEMSQVQPVFLPVPGKGVLFYEMLAKTGAAESGQIYGQIGLNHGLEENHATITDLG
jgi:hypothetical protein